MLKHKSLIIISFNFVVCFRKDDYLCKKLQKRAFFTYLDDVTIHFY